MSEQNKNLRIIGKYECEPDIEKKIRNMEILYNVDFKSLPQWKDVIHKINSAQTEYRDKLLKAKNREYEIIKRLYTQNYRVSPFKLSDKLARTAKLWKKRDNYKKTPKFPSKIEHSIISLDNIFVEEALHGEESFNKSVAHPNSEVILTKDQTILKSEEEHDSKTNPAIPLTICTNPHKILSSIMTNYIALSYKDSKIVDKDFKSDTINESLPNQTQTVKCYPEKIVIYNNSLQPQSVKFYLVNCGFEYVNVRFKSVSDISHFKTYRILPEIPYKLNAGLTKHYKFNFTLLESVDDRTNPVTLYFRIGCKTGEEILRIPVSWEFDKSNYVIISETVNIPQVYMWQVNAKHGYPKGIVKIQTLGNTAYDLHIRRKDVDFINESEGCRTNDSLNPTLTTESLMQKLNDVDIETQNNIINPNITDTNNEIDTSISLYVVTLVLNDILDLVYEPFIFKNSYFRLSPKTKRIALVYFTKAKHVGYYSKYYEFIFCEPDDSVSFTKTIKVFAEVLPHPIRIYPTMMDLSKSPVIFGHCEDQFTIINAHKVYPVIIAIKTTDKMDKIFNITPRVTTIPAKSNIKFKIMFCKETIENADFFDIMAYFTLKIVIKGDNSIYKNVPPIYYEIIAPCAKKFLRIYDKQYLLNELSE